MDPRFLRTFVTVARLGSFSRAAAELGYTQSAVSQHIAILEADLGTALLSRRPVEPTSAGERLLEHAEPILLRLDAARADVARVVGGPRRPLRIGATPLAAGFAAERVDASRADTVRVADRVAVARAVATGELDEGFVDGVAAVNDPLRLPEVGLLVAAAGRSRSRSRSRPTIRCSGGPSPWRTSSTRAGSTRRSCARRWTSWPRSPAPTASAPRCATTAPTSRGCSLWSPPATASRCCRRRVVGDGLALGSPPLVHRTELVRVGALSAHLEPMFTSAHRGLTTP